ncbi:hypothetical protein AB0E85_31970 [Streptomyces sp. NPDC029044]|uniref:hypothetical protein n=1 Tax=Streptomyces sp. NPDC029044 TaxID=3157198 RepID=UPI0033F6FEE1
MSCRSSQSRSAACSNITVAATMTSCALPVSYTWYWPGATGQSYRLMSHPDME